MVLGILFIGLCVSFLRLSRFGVDPFSAMNLGISGFIGWSFGTWQLLVNAIILVVVFFQVGIIDGESRVFFYHVAEKAHLIAFALFGYKRDALDQNFTHSDHLRSASAERVERARVNEVFDEPFIQNFRLASRYEIFKRFVLSFSFSFGNYRIYRGESYAFYRGESVSDFAF